MRSTGVNSFVTGGTGAIGPSLVQRLLSKNVHVRVLSRGSGIASPSGTILVPGRLDAVHPASLDRATHVFHLAALLHINDPSPDLRQRYFDVNVEGTRRLLDAASDAGEPRFIFFSTINVYGEGTDGQSVYTEDSPLNPSSWYAESKVKAEELVREYPNAVILRLGAVYGPTMKGNYVSLARLLGKGVRLMVGNGKNRRTLVHVEDVVNAAILAAEHPVAVGKTFNITDGNIHTFDDIARAIQEAQGRKEGMVYLPAEPFKWVLAGGKSIADRVGFSRFPSPMLVDKLTEDMAVSGDKIKRDLGYVPQYDLRSGWKQTLNEIGGGK